MKPLVSILSTLACALAISHPLPAMADTQPNEQYDKSHCKAAFDADDWVSVVVYCKAEAEDHAVDADSDTGSMHWLDIGLEAVCLNMVAFGKYYGDHDHGEATVLGSEARQLFQSIVTNADPDVVALARHSLTQLSTMPWGRP